MAEGGFERRGSAFTIAGRCFPFNGLVEVTGEHHCAELETQVSDHEEQGNAYGPPLGALVVDVSMGHSEVRAQLVRSPAKLTSNRHALDGPCRVPERTGDLDRRARDVARESVLFEEHGAVVPGDHVENFLQGTVSDEAVRDGVVVPRGQTRDNSFNVHLEI